MQYVMNGLNEIKLVLMRVRSRKCVAKTDIQIKDIKSLLFPQNYETFFAATVLKKPPKRNH